MNTRSKINTTFHWLKSAGHAFSELFYPSVCAVCGRKLSSSEREICPPCFLALPLWYTSEDYRTIRIEGNGYIVSFHALFSFSQGNTTRQLIHSLKYKKRRRIGLEMGRIAARRFGWSKENIDLIIPVPISPEHRAIRGYNQSMSIASGISQESGIPATDLLIKRKRHGHSQTSRSAEERQAAISDAFYCVEPDQLHSKRVLLVDDVLTTGATLSEVAGILSKAGCSYIEAFTIAVSL
ncbi:hypothetical protein HQ45_08405 [Porphyromonas crevioricanis]|nr:hypothetical protein HQ45_08405 [Porphyromonas crevioricanis]GAD05409.1 competence protein F homolog, phosphoribosyltransferase domain; protein YhgH required for utilization of DNA as sole source of carbon and energy [Porphyromonas crevioricanis JCM 15906]GAD07633.1 competence protein F homolog, phosphoribosyltransferase domain; protein YhgH required for utilization of DNA as sole source of carbon and energy [Porphyromonas crevioricanis JCM 13913]